MRLIDTVFLLLVVSSMQAQDRDKMFRLTEEKEIKHGMLITVDGAFDVPAADMAKRFGDNYRIGPAILFKTKRNFVFGAKCDFILGNVVRQDSLMINIRDRYSGQSTHLYEFINNSGERIGVPVYERGYIIGLQFGKIFALDKEHPDDGLVVLASAGFIQHKIDIYDKDKSVPQLLGPYLKGYDRLTNGSFAELYAGYALFSRSEFLNFTIGLDALFGFTQGRRDYLFDVMHADTESRLDILYGVRASWFLPVFKKKSEDLLFE